MTFSVSAAMGTQGKETGHSGCMVGTLVFVEICSKSKNFMKMCNNYSAVLSGSVVKCDLLQHLSNVM